MGLRLGRGMFGRPVEWHSVARQHVAARQDVDGLAGNPARGVVDLEVE